MYHDIADIILLTSSVIATIVQLGKLDACKSDEDYEKTEINLAALF